MAESAPRRWEISATKVHICVRIPSPGKPPESRPTFGVQFTYGRSQSQTRRACFLTASYPRKALRAHPKLAALREITWQYACTMAVTASATRMRSRLSQGCRRAPTGSVARLMLPRGAFFHRMRAPPPPQAPQRHSRIPAKVGLKQLAVRRKALFGERLIQESVGFYGCEAVCRRFVQA